MPGPHREDTQARSHNRYKMPTNGSDDVPMDVDQQDTGLELAIARSLEDTHYTLDDPENLSIGVARGMELSEVAPSRSSERVSPELSTSSNLQSTPSATPTPSTGSDHTLSSLDPLAGPGEDTFNPSLYFPELPPPNYDIVVRQGRAKPLCTICNERPAYNDGSRAFPTCGNTCARKLKAMNDQRSYGYQRPFANAYEGSSNGYNSRSLPIKMCIVCKTRPRYEKGGKSYDTCGLTCAAKIGPKPGDKCEFCQIKPKAIINRKQLPYCSIACEDKAKKLAAAVANSSTCSTCLLCWKEAKDGRNDFCSPICASNFDNRSPCLLEIPRGHVSFKKVSEFFSAAWKDTKTPCPSIKRIYMVGMSRSTMAAHIAYQNRVEHSRGFLRLKTPNVKTTWLKGHRQCSLGDTGVTEPCAIPTCFLCSLLRTAIHPEIFTKGIESTGHVDRLITHASGKKQKARSRVVLLANVVLGNELELTLDEERILAPEYDSIRLLQRRSSLLSSKVYHEDAAIVFSGEAVRPLYIISYESD